MKTIAQLRRYSLSLPLSISAALFSALAILAAGTPIARAAGQAAAPAVRISAEINSSQMTALPNSKNPRAQAQSDERRTG